MSLIISANSKSNVKQLSSNDLPFAPSQPVMSSYYATSTSGQTVINLNFLIQTTGSYATTDQFWLFVDGKKLDLGASNDYTFTSVASDGSSSQVTLNQSLASGLNIQAFKMGLKPEIQFGMDNRFLQLYSQAADGFQSYVSPSANLMSATSTAGTPSSGTFYSSITGRAAMPDLSQDLKPRFGVERIPVQQLYTLQNEFGQNGEPVLAALNDTVERMRFVGGWNTVINTTGPYANPTSASDYMEVTFYGTGLNLLFLNYASARAITYSVDGGSGTNATLSTASSSAVITARNYPANNVFNVVSGLTAGVHTVKINFQAASTFEVFGFEILNETSTVSVNPGIAYASGLKINPIAQQTYNPLSTTYDSTSGTAGTRGGRVLVYLDSSGTVRKSIQYVNTSAAALSYAGTGYSGGSADHTNEEVARTYHFREFGAGRNPNGTQDDFSFNGSAVSRAFTLDDGVTTLIGSNVSIVGATGGVTSGVEAVWADTSNFYLFTFVGTGLDIEIIADGTTRTSTVYIDGVSIGTISKTASTARETRKIVSGLPYGTHTVKFVAGTSGIGTVKFIVYQPKLPTLPSGCVALGDYNVVANYVAATGASPNAGPISTGVISKMNTREVVYVGSGWAVNATVYNSQTESGFRIDTTTTGNSVQYTFFGTGFEIGAQSNNANVSATLSVTGPQGTVSGASLALTLAPTTSVSWTAATSTILWSAAMNNMIQVTGLPLGTYTVKLTKATSTNALLFDCFNVITPIHSYKSNLYADLQNTLTVGSNAISDDRNLTPIKDSLPVQKAWAQAVGITSAPTTTSTTVVLMPDMSCTVKTSGGPLKISYSVSLYVSAVNVAPNLWIVLDGLTVSTGKVFQGYGSSTYGTVSDTIIVPVSAGTHKVDIYWSTSSGTATAASTTRNLTVEEK
jgi:hypothetical protein